jgi:thiopeptide-type bacteriocin biosynthesis protein
MSKAAPPSDFIPSGFFVLRTPLLPFDELLAWSNGLEALSAGDDPRQIEAALAADRARLRQRLRTVFTRPEVREALFVASPDLEERFNLWLQDTPPRSASEGTVPEGEGGQKMERTLVRYFARMAGRATPFGLFAGCSVGMVDTNTRLVLAERARYRRHTRLDMDYLVLLTDALARDPHLLPGMKFTVNTSLCPTRGCFHYCEVRRNGKGWTHHQVALEATDYLEATLAPLTLPSPLGEEGRVRGASVTPATLVAALLQHDPDASREEAEEYVADLIDHQVLVSELRPAVTGPEPVRGLIDQLRQCGAVATSDRLEAAQQELEALDAGGLGNEPARYREIVRLLGDLPGEMQLGSLLQVDMVKPMASASLGPVILDEIRYGIELLHRLARRPRQDRLARFREAFCRRYEGREVPLVEALDEDTGIGFDTLLGGTTTDSALLDGLSFPEAAAEMVPWRPREVLLLGKLSEALSAGRREITLTATDLEKMAEPNPLPLPDAFSALAAVAAGSEEAASRGEFRVLLDGTTGPSGARWLGRFCHGDPQLHQQVEQHVQAEEALHPDAIFAEIVHLPEGRVGNILARPILREYEIPYLGRAAVAAERQLAVTDLCVSVIGEQIILRSARLGRRVLPRLTCAHNFHSSQGIYRFLCELQAQETAGDLGWDWGPLRDAPFLPRVVSGRLVLSRANWQVSRDELRRLSSAHGVARFRAVQEWRTARRLPRWVALADGDNELPIDLDNILAIETFVELVKGEEQARLVELFPGPDELWARGPEGRFVQELVVPFIRQGVRSRASGVRGQESPESWPLTPVPLQRRSFPPGSEWLYVKLYTGPATADQVLHEMVRPVVESALGSGAADRWFFVRYSDPDWHLRLRFHGQADRLTSEVLPALQTSAAPLLDDGRLWRLQLDTYEREVERYGGTAGIELAERFFHVDSEAILALAGSNAGDARGDIRWRLAVAGMHHLLVDLGFDCKARRAIVCRARDEFAAEFQVDASFRHQLGSKFRAERRRLELLLEPTADIDSQLILGREVLHQRSGRLAAIVSELHTCAAAGRLTVPLADLAASYLHMHANRLLRSAHRPQELVLYDFLARIYQSQAARLAGREEILDLLPPTTDNQQLAIWLHELR